ncbi:hypothetical protein RHMOL_Rhmol11G0011200 [Rhododendron molle]|uniref:Uncharacterized protein n=1 Tax=Rhododendron molle TaxID=49168 RepID=A0ACC0LMY5_RHOML|nr:hypothetical protein RHMOL_Rhmol11G0011200 [Rhododendron molle]
MKAATSGTSSSGLGSTSQSQFTPEEVAKAKTALRMALLKNFQAIVHPARASNVKKAMDVLVKSQALGPNDASLQYFQKEFPNMVKTHDASTQDLSKVHAKLSELEKVDMEITRFSTEWNQLKEDIIVNRANNIATSEEIQELKDKLAQAEGCLEDLQKESKILAKQHEDLKAGSKSQKLKLNLLIEEVPDLCRRWETLEAQLTSLSTAWRT